jgi:uncharacterized membrane protein
MNDEQDTNEPQEDQAQAESPPAAPEAAPASSGIDSQEIENGKAFAILSYGINFLCLPFFLVPLIMRDNSFSLYHAKQCLIIALITVVGGVVSTILLAVCVGVILWILVGIFWYVWNILGLINACKGEAKPLPLVGNLAEQWCKGITKT